MTRFLAVFLQPAQHFHGLPARGVVQRIDLALVADHIAAVELSQQILARLLEAGGSLPLSDKSSPEDIHRLFGVSKGTFKKAIGGLYKKGLILIHPERIELPR